MAAFTRKYQIISAVVGLVGVLGLLALSFAIPNPSEYQMSNLRLLRALFGAAAFGGLVGTIKVQANIKGFAIQATSAAAAAIVFYFL